MNMNIALVPGDGIGPEIVEQAVRVLDKVADRFGHKVTYTKLLAGGCAIDATGKPLPEETLEQAKAADSVLLGAVGGPRWEHLDGIRPEQALLGLRAGLGLYANLRPALLYQELKFACPLKPEIIGDNLDIMIVRELTGGIYFGGSGREGDSAYDTERYSKAEIERVLRVAAKIAQGRKKKLTVVDKANVLESSRLWREVAEEVLAGSGLEVNYLYVDNATMQLVRNPQQFDVIVTSNMFGDILSDEASMLTGSIGMLPSASLGDGKKGMYEPIHGSAPDIAGKGIANPLATILSVAMMLRHSFDLEEEARAIENAVRKTLQDGMRTADLIENSQMVVSSTKEMGDAVLARL